MIKNYSPNIRWGKQHVELTLMQWDYKKVITVDVGGNCTGFDVIECAVTSLYDDLADKSDVAQIILHRDNGDTLEVSDEEMRAEEWLKAMLVSTQIVGWTPPTVNEVRAMNGGKALPDGDRPWSPA